MQHWITWIAVALGGAVGACSRFAVGQIMIKLHPSADFPYGTFIVNLLGAFLLGIIYVLGKENWIGAPYRLFWATGVMGALTTFSTFAVEGISLMEQGRPRMALLYWLSCLISGILLAYFGMLIAGRITGTR